jgi:hypothetical protein
MKRTYRPEIVIAATIAWFGMAITPAMATTIIQTGTNVTAIDGIVIAGNTYNVTFGTTVDTTFNTLSAATTAAGALRAALNADATALTVAFSDFSFIVCSSPSGPVACNGDVSANQSQSAGGWSDLGAFTGIPVNVDSPAAAFTLLGTPEPVAMTTVGLGLGIVFLVTRLRRPSKDVQ